MPSDIRLFIDGKPRGKGRPRFTKFGKPYKLAEDRDAEQRVVDIWEAKGAPSIREQCERVVDGVDISGVEVAIKVDVFILVKRPPGHFTSKGKINTKGLRHPLPENQKPDVDNVAKLILDALNKKAYKDDVRVTDARQRRRWSRTREGVYVTISEDNDWGDLE